MRRSSIASIVLSLLLSLGGCGPRKAPADEAAGVERERCESGGGVMRKVCLSGRLACVTPFSDAGQPCTDSSQCEGMCLVRGEPPEPGTEVVGGCQKDDDPCGCFVEVRDGKSRQGLCAD